MSDFINADVDIGKFNTIIAIMRRCSVETRPVMAAVGNLVVKSVRRNFREGGRPNKWPESKKPKGKTLIGTGALMKSIHYELDNDGTAVTVMTGPMNYARTMQNGGSTAAHEIWYKNRQALRFFVFPPLIKSPYKTTNPKDIRSLLQKNLLRMST